MTEDAFTLEVRVDDGMSNAHYLKHHRVAFEVALSLVPWLMELGRKATPMDTWPHASVSVPMSLVVDAAERTAHGWVDAGKESHA